jgi:Pentapeptide repeats (8 copies)
MATSSLLRHVAGRSPVRIDAVAAAGGFWPQLWRALVRDTPAFSPGAQWVRLPPDPAKGRRLIEELLSASPEGRRFICRQQLRHRDLVGADLRDAPLPGADLTSAVLAGADLSRADLRKAVLRSAVLRSANVSRARLNKADFGNADLTGAALCNAVLVDVRLPGADLSGADLSDANLDGADLSRAGLRRVNLQGVRWTDETKWPPDQYDAIRRQSHELHPGVFRFGRGGSQLDPLAVGR